MALICFWSAVKFFGFIPISAIALLIARASERRTVNEFIAAETAVRRNVGGILAASTKADRRALLKALRE